MNNILILHSNWNALSVIHALKAESNASIFLIDSSRGIASHSKYVSEFFEVYDPTINEEKTYQDIRSIISKLKGTIFIIPTSDHWATMLAKYSIEFEPHVKCLVSSYQVIDMLINKNKFYRWALVRGFSVPEFINTEGTEINYPIVAKFEFRRKSTEDGDALPNREIVNKLRIKFIGSDDELTAYKQENEKWLQYIVFQECIHGLSNQMHTIGVYARDGIVKTLFSGRKVRGYPPDVGDCIVGEVRGCPDEIIQEVKGISSLLNYTGIAEFEYKIDVETNRYRLIEINPRTWSWVGVTNYLQGLNLISNAYRDIILRQELDYNDSIDIKDSSIRFIRIYEDCLNNILRYDKTIPFKVGIITWIREFFLQKNVIPEMFEFRIFLISSLGFVKSLLRHLMVAKN